MWWLLFVVHFAPTRTVMGRPEGVVAFVCGAFCVHGVHGAPRIQSCTKHWKTELQISGGVVQICFGFFPMLHSS